MIPDLDKLDVILSELQDRERRILYMYFVQKLSLADIGKRGVGINGKSIGRDRVRQVLINTIRKVRREMKIKMLMTVNDF